jgi:hypothetical protein
MLLAHGNKDTIENTDAVCLYASSTYFLLTYSQVIAILGTQFEMHVYA